MIKKILMPLFLVLTISSSYLQATIENNEGEGEEEQEEIVEFEKCKKLEVLLLGNRFDAKRVAAFLTSNSIGLVCEVTFTFLNQSKSLSLLFNTYQLLSIPLRFLIHYKLLKQYKVNGIPTSMFVGGPMGELTYALFNKLMLNSAFEKLLQNHDPKAIPTCIKEQLDALAEQYKNNNLTKYEIHEAAHEILVQLNEIMNGKI